MTQGFKYCELQELGNLHNILCIILQTSGVLLGGDVCVPRRNDVTVVVLDHKGHWFLCLPKASGSSRTVLF